VIDFSATDITVIEEWKSGGRVVVKQSCKRCGMEYGIDESHPDGGCRSIAAAPVTVSRCGRCPNARTVFDPVHGRGRQRVCRRTGQDVTPYIQEGKTPKSCPLAKNENGEGG